VTSTDPRASWEAAQEAIFDEIRTYGRPKTGYFAGQDVLLLQTKGAKSGEHRVSPLTFSRDGERLVVVASKGGAPTNPAWFANLVANPIVTVETGGEKFEARATAVTAGPERDRLTPSTRRPFRASSSTSDKRLAPSRSSSSSGSEARCARRAWR
jgi:deazaflavin-dependent oxidoreductase (nitroreductase family)